MRNLIFSSLLAAYAESNNCDYICLGIQKSDAGGYWDTTEDFVRRLQAVLNLNRKNKIRLIAPFVNNSKAEEIAVGRSLGVDYFYTWTSYSGPKKKNGEDWDYRKDPEFKEGPYSEDKDNAAHERREAFRKLGLEDPIPYL
jgi:7-cyano-7-deazaguanine synthase